MAAVTHAEVRRAPDSREDIFLWSDGTWCYREELHEMSHMSDDFEIIRVDEPRHADFLATA